MNNNKLFMKQCRTNGRQGYPAPIILPNAYAQNLSNIVLFLWSCGFLMMSTMRRMRPSGKDRLLKMKPNGLRRGLDARHEFNRFCSATMNTGSPESESSRSSAHGRARRGRARESLDHLREAPYLHSITLLIMLDIMASIVKLVC